MMESSEQLPSKIDPSEDSLPGEEGVVDIHGTFSGNQDDSDTGVLDIAVLGSEAEHYIEINGQQLLVQGSCVDGEYMVIVPDGYQIVSQESREDSIAVEEVSPDLDPGSPSPEENEQKVDVGVEDPNDQQVESVGNLTIREVSNGVAYVPDSLSLMTSSESRIKQEKLMGFHAAEQNIPSADASPENTEDTCDLTSRSNVEEPEVVSQTGADVSSATMYPASETEEDTGTDLVSEHNDGNFKQSENVKINNENEDFLYNKKNQSIQLSLNDNSNSKNSLLSDIVSSPSTLNKELNHVEPELSSKQNVKNAIDTYNIDDDSTEAENDSNLLIIQEDKNREFEEEINSKSDASKGSNRINNDKEKSSRKLSFHEAWSNVLDKGESTGKEICDVEFDGSDELFHNSAEIKENDKLSQDGGEAPQNNGSSGVEYQEVLNKNDLNVELYKKKGHAVSSLSKTNVEEDMMDHGESLVKTPKRVYFNKRKLKQNKEAENKIELFSCGDLAENGAKSPLDVGIQKETKNIWNDSNEEMAVEEDIQSNVQSRVSTTYKRKREAPYSCIQCPFIATSANILVLHYKYCPSVLETIKCKVNDLNKLQMLRGEGACGNSNASRDNNKHKKIRLDNSNESTEDSRDKPDISMSLACTVNNKENDDAVDDKEKKLGFAEKDVVWIKRGRYHWPALVWEINEKGALFYVIDSPDHCEPLKLRTQSFKKLLHTFDDVSWTHKMLENSKRMPGNLNYVKAVQKANSYITHTKVLVDSDFDVKSYFNISDYKRKRITKREKFLKKTGLLKKSKKSKKSKLSLKDKESQEKKFTDAPRQEDKEESTDDLDIRKVMKCIWQRQCNDHVLSLYRKTIPSKRHALFEEDESAKELEDLSWFGPLNSDSAMQLKLYDHFYELYKEKVKGPPNASYIYKVWIPEGIIKAISLVNNKTLEEAEHIFLKKDAFVKGSSSL